jgi:hypothetical protein
MRKPEIGAYYRIFKDKCTPEFVMKVLDIDGDIAYYVTMNEKSFIRTWDFVAWTEHLDYKLSSLEMELL